MKKESSSEDYYQQHISHQNSSYSDQDNHFIENEVGQNPNQEAYGDENDNQNEYPNSRTKFLSIEDLNELFDYEENDRSRRELKRNFKELAQSYDGKVKFKNLVGKFPHC